MCVVLLAEDAVELFAFLASTVLVDFEVVDMVGSAGAIGKEGAVFEFGMLREALCRISLYDPFSVTMITLWNHSLYNPMA